MIRVDARGSGSSWQPMINGKPVDTPRCSYDQAMVVAERLALAERTKPRNCMACGKSFLSTGPGHRLCNIHRSEG
ncbi:hypothetical protein P775_08270 [Puniceibacterium antarcticum]|uniref:C2H2-type domain-containing protein n=1 Tax=Puniceibacterium antarcticum TaxID=1206336 RepID=A0A2G8RG07_9RHOB|nr:hypothetical protein [Puniceibacterium antarcticum]PIL20514.1 hypothetical protein P775_08270 [Puniceibacterium antarcticum]